MKFECTFWNPESQLDIGETEYIEADNKTEALKTMLKGKTNTPDFIKVWSDVLDYNFFEIHKANDGSIIKLVCVEGGEIIELEGKNERLEKPKKSSRSWSYKEEIEEKPDGITLNEGVISLLGYAINALQVIALLVLIIGSFWFIGENPELMETTEGFFTFILGFIMYVFAYVISVGIMCLLLSINDHLKKIVSIHEKQL